MSGMRLQRIVAFLFVATVAWAVWSVRGWVDQWRDRNDPPTPIPAEEVRHDLPEPEIPLLERPFKRDARPTREGTAPPRTEDEPRRTRYAAKVLRSTGLDVPDSLVSAADTTPEYPWVRGEAKGPLTLAVERSDGSVVRREYDDCNRGIEFGTQDTTMFAHCQRAIAGLPDFARDVGVCGVFGGVTYGSAMALESKQAVLWGIAGGLACFGITRLTD